MILPVPAGPGGPGGRLESAEASSSWISWDLMGSKGTHMDMGKCMGKSWKMMENDGKWWKGDGTWREFWKYLPKIQIYPNCPMLRDWVADIHGDVPNCLQLATK